MLVGTCRKFNLPVDIQIDMYNNMMVPVVIYASEILRLYIIREIQIMQTKLLKHSLFVHKNYMQR